MFHLNLQLDWLPNAQFAGVLYAPSLGWYRQAGIDLSILPWQAHTNQIDQLILDENYVVSTEDNLLIQACAAGHPVKAIGSMMQYSGIGWMSLKQSGIQSLADLKGRRLGIHPDGKLAIKVALANQGMSPDDLEINDVGFDYIELLTNDELDAMQCLIMVEPLEMATAGHPVDVIRGYDLGYQVYAQVIATTDRLIQQQPDMLTRFLKVTFDGWRKAFEEPEESSRIVVDEYLKDSSVELQKQMLLAMRPVFEGEVGMEKLGWMEEKRWQTSIDYLVNKRMIEVVPSVKEVMTSAFISQI